MTRTGVRVILTTSIPPAPIRPQPCPFCSLELCLAPGEASRVQAGFGGFPTRGRATARRGSERDEIGHALDWPHSYSGLSDEYDNFLDVMSLAQASIDNGVWVAGGTIAFNPPAAGWVPTNQVYAHSGGTKDYRIGPLVGGSPELLIIPSKTSGALRPLGRAGARGRGRPAQRPVGRGFSGIPRLGDGGVTVHLVDQSAAACAQWPGFDSPCYGAQRRHAPWPAVPDGDKHLLHPGDTLDIGGVAVEVRSRSGDEFTVRVSGGAFTFPRLSLGLSALATEGQLEDLVRR